MVMVVICTSLCIRGLCGIFDGDKSNDFHDRDGRIMDLKMFYGQVDKFPEQWRFILATL